MARVPKDELLLAEMIAAAKAKGLGWTSFALFRDKRRVACAPARAAMCCAAGALILVGRARYEGSKYTADVPARMDGVGFGNDRADWRKSDDDRGESIGYAFRCAMESP